MGNSDGYLTVLPAWRPRNSPQHPEQSFRKESRAFWTYYHPFTPICPHSLHPPHHSTCPGVLTEENTGIWVWKQAWSQEITPT